MSDDTRYWGTPKSRDADDGMPGGIDMETDEQVTPTDFIVVVPAGSSVRFVESEKCETPIVVDLEEVLAAAVRAVASQEAGE